MFLLAFQDTALLWLCNGGGLCLLICVFLKDTNICVFLKDTNIQKHKFASLSHGSVMAMKVVRSVCLFVQGTSHCVPLSLESLLHKMSSHLSAEQKLQHRFILRNLSN